MVEQQLRPRGITDMRVLEALSVIPRERFVPAEWQGSVYEDRALPIGSDQTISQPYIVALMTEKLQVEADHRVLEVGTGSGYQTAVLSRLAREVFTVERIVELSHRAWEALEGLGVRNVTVKVDDGTMGWPEAAPFDRILVTAGAPAVPAPLTEQLRDGGILVIPVGPPESQTLMRIRRSGITFHQEPVIGCRFVKLIGAAGWQEEERT